MSLIATIGYGTAFALLALAIWRVGRKNHRRTEAKAAVFLRSTLPPTKAALDTGPGFNLALQDECELIYDMPAYGTTDEPGQRDAFVERLLDAIRDQQEGEQA